MKNRLSIFPNGWIEKAIEDVCTSPQYGYTTKAVENGDIKLLRTTDITSGKINWKAVPYCLKNPENPEKYILNDGDVVISRAGSVGVSHLIAKPEKAVFASYLIRFNPLINKNSSNIS
jgi:type I restriction enzyme, S subunit